MVERGLNPSLAVVLATVLFSALVGGSQQFPEDNPELGVYQNEGEYLSLEEDWYEMYRNFQEDPYFGGKAKCIVATQISQSDDGSATLIAKYDDDTCMKVRGTPKSSPGYTVNNVLQVDSLDNPGVSFNMTNVYKDEKQCMVARHSYADGGKGCSLWRPESAIGKGDSCCDFIFDLVCGTSKKYQIYNDCLTGN